MKNRILTLVLVSWIALWAVFFLRELFVKKNILDYQALLSRTLEGKRAFVMGDRPYEFIRYCVKNIPETSTYDITGIDEGELKFRHAVYHLYPRLESKDPEYLIDMSGYTLKKVR